MFVKSRFFEPSIFRTYLLPEVFFFSLDKFYPRLHEFHESIEFEIRHASHYTCRRDSNVGIPAVKLNPFLVWHFLLF